MQRRAWRVLPACCLAAACGTAVPTDQAPAPPPSLAVQLSTVDVGCPDVASARRALVTRSDVSTRTENGWLVVELPALQEPTGQAPMRGC